MITYWPIILDSTVSAYSIWLAIRGSRVTSEEGYLDLNVVCRSGTLVAGKNIDFYEDREEGFDQTIFRLPVLKSELENMVENIKIKVEAVRYTDEALNFKFSSAFENQYQLQIQILKQESESNLSFQFCFRKEEVWSHFQIQTSAENILVFMDEMQGEIKKHCE
jgi:hypothetical protein